MELNTPIFGETPWHRDWKKSFPPSFREVCFRDELLGEQHRADVHTPCGTTIEFQNSPICIDELESREAYYPNLVWVLNGKKFKGFRILKHLPDVDSAMIASYEFCHTDHLTMIRKSDLLHGRERAKPLSFHHPELRSVPLSSYYYSFCWKHPHRVWYQAKCPIIVDLGGHFLYQLKQRKQLSGDYPYLHMFSRKEFIQRYIGN
ncbi:MAG: competence protein [Pedobacter sp.]|nr:MAG: competence protein [Pedobacter sp.]